MKRRYEHKNGQLIDRQPGKTVYGVKPQQAGTVVRLLQRIEHAQDWDAASMLIERRARPHVRSAVAKLAKRQRSDNQAVWRVLGDLGGREARASLERRLRVLIRSKRTWKTRKKNWNRNAQEAASIARDLLSLDREHTFAARLLVRMFKHPEPYIRMFSVWEAALLYARANDEHVHTEAVETLERALRRTERTKEQPVFIKAIPALISFSCRAVIARCKRLFRDKDPWLRRDTAWMLVATKTPHIYVPLVLELIDIEPSVETRLELMRFLHPMVSKPIPGMERACKQGLADESPSIRSNALEVVEHLERSVRRRLVRAALNDEPDPLLRKHMRRALR